MEDTLWWQTDLKEFIGELQKCWAGGYLSQVEPVVREDPKVSSFVYGYPTFSGSRAGYRVLVTAEYFHHGVTSIMKEGDHQEMLCLSLKKPQKRFVSLLHRQWFDKKIEKMSKEWQAESGDATLDETYFMQGKTHDDREFVNSSSFVSLVRDMLPFSSLSIDDTGVKLNIPIKDKSQFDVVAVDRLWGRMLDLAK